MRSPVDQKIYLIVTLLAILFMLTFSSGCDNQDQTAETPNCPPAASPESPAMGNYQVLRYPTQEGIVSVAIANRGIRAVAGSENYNVYVFERNKTEPLFTFRINDQQVHDVDITRDGAAIAAAGGAGLLYLFSCDNPEPAWTYDTGVDINNLPDSDVMSVAFSPDGEWLGAVSESHVYLFRKDNGTPVMKRELSTSGALATIAVSNGGNRIAVGDSYEEINNEESQIHLYLLDQQGLIWKAELGRFTAAENAARVEVAISADGHIIAAGGGDRTVHLWSDSSSVPLWSYTISEESEVSSLALSDSGKELVVTGGGNKLFFWRDTAQTTPSYIYDGDFVPFCSSGQEKAMCFFGFNYPDVYQGMTSDPKFYGISQRDESTAISADGLYYIAGAYANNHAFHFFRDMDYPFRLYNLSDPYEHVYAVDLSPDGSWIILSSGNEVMRIEVAPAEMIEIEQPFTYEITSEKLAQGVDMLDIPNSTEAKVHYWILKPGRPAKLKEEWTFWMIFGGAPLAPVNLPTQDDKKMVWEHDLSDGNQFISESRNVKVPKSLNIPGVSYDEALHPEYYFLLSDFSDASSGKVLSRDGGIVMKFIIGDYTGGLTGGG